MNSINDTSFHDDSIENNIFEQFNNAVIDYKLCLKDLFDLVKFVQHNSQ